MKGVLFHQDCAPARKSVVAMANFLYILAIYTIPINFTYVELTVSFALFCL